MSLPFGIRASELIGSLGVGNYPGRVASTISIPLGGTHRNVLLIFVSLYYQLILHVHRRLVQFPRKMLSSFPVWSPAKVAVFIHNTVVPYSLRQVLIDVLPM